MSLSEYRTFASWAELLDYINAGYDLFYLAPMEYQPARITAVVRKDGKIRVYPHWASGADPFTADLTHLSRFRKAGRS